MFEAYVDRIATLFHETGDTLSIPRRLSLHVDLGSEPVFTELLGKAVKRTIKAEPNIIPMSKEIISRTYEETTKGSPQTIPNDTALLLSAMFFHTQEKPGHLSISRSYTVEYKYVTKMEFAGHPSRSTKKKEVTYNRRQIFRHNHKCHDRK